LISGLGEAACGKGLASQLSPWSALNRKPVFQIIFRYVASYLQYLVLWVIFCLCGGNGNQLLKSRGEGTDQANEHTQTAPALEVIQSPGSDSSLLLLIQPTATDGPGQRVPLPDFIVPLPSVFALSEVPSNPDHSVIPPKKVSGIA